MKGSGIIDQYETNHLVRANQSPSDIMSSVCLGSSNIHFRARRYKYVRRDALQRHFETHDSNQHFPEGRTCDYPGCEEVLHTLPKYRFHGTQDPIISKSEILQWTHIPV